MPNAYGYARVSSDRQAREGLSLEGQDAAILEYYHRAVEHRGVEWGGMVVDPAVSATKKGFRQRPGGSVLFAGLQRDDHVIFARLDRGFRKAPRPTLEGEANWPDSAVVEGGPRE